MKSGLVILSFVLVLGLVVAGIWGAATYTNQRAAALQAQATLELARTTHTALWGILALVGLLGLGLLLMSGACLYLCFRWLSRPNPTRRLSTMPAVPPLPAGWEAWMPLVLSQLALLQAPWVRQLPLIAPALPDPAAEVEESAPWDIPPEWF